MWPNRVYSEPLARRATDCATYSGPLALESDALPTALRDPAGRRRGDIEDEGKGERVLIASRGGYCKPPAFTQKPLK